MRYQSEFDSVFRHARKLKSGFVTALLVPNTVGVPRLGVVVAKRFIPRANKRNRLKRLMREAFRYRQAQVGAHDLVMMVNKDIPLYADSLWPAEINSMMTKVIASSNQHTGCP